MNQTGPPTAEQMVEIRQSMIDGIASLGDVVHMVSLRQETDQWLAAAREAGMSEAQGAVVAMLGLLKAMYRRDYWLEHPTAATAGAAALLMEALK